MPNSIFPIIPPAFFALDGELAIASIGRYRRIRPDSLHNSVFLCPCEKMGHVRKESIDLVRGVDNDFRVSHGEGDLYLAAVGC
jgi:hypothetical protein